MRARDVIGRAVVLAGLLLAVSAGPATAQMSVVVKVFQDFAADGRIDPCKHTSEELRLVLKTVPPDIEQYAADYPNAVKAALEARARGDCAGKQPATPATAVPSATPQATPTATPTPVPTAVPTKTVVPEPPAPPGSTSGGLDANATAAARPDVVLERVATARPTNQAPVPVLLLALLGGLLGTFALFLLATRRLGWGEERLAGPRHTWQEATWRASGVWQDFRDWLKLGR